MKKFKTFISEARKNPEVNTKHSAWEMLQKYVRYDHEDQTITLKKRGKEVTVDANEVFIHMGAEFKVGINPQSKFDTPNGIYFYKLKNVWDYYNLESNSMDNLPWAGKQPFVWVCTWNGKENFVEDMKKDFSRDEYNRAMPIVKAFYEKNKPQNTTETFEQLRTDAEDDAIYPNAMMQFWNVTRTVAEKIVGRQKSDLYERAALIWTQILRLCGYVGFNDNGHGWIYDDEPMQAVFLQKDALDVIDVIHNKYINNDIDRELYAFLKMNKFQFDTATNADVKNNKFGHEDMKRLNEYVSDNNWFYKLKPFSGRFKIGMRGNFMIFVKGVGATSLVNKTVDITSPCVFSETEFYKSKITFDSDSSSLGAFRYCYFDQSEISNVDIHDLSLASDRQTKNSTFNNCVFSSNYKVDEFKKLGNVFNNCTWNGEKI